MELESVLIFHKYKINEQTVLCTINVKPRNVQYIAKKSYFARNWVLPEQWAAFEAALETQLIEQCVNKNWQDFKEVDLKCFPLLCVKIKQQNISEVNSQCFDLLSIKKCDIKLFLECYIKIDAHLDVLNEKTVKTLTSTEIEEEYEPTFISENSNESVKVPAYKPTKRVATIVHKTQNVDNCQLENCTPQQTAVNTNCNEQSVIKHSSSPDKAKITNKAGRAAITEHKDCTTGNIIKANVKNELDDDEYTHYIPEPITSSASPNGVPYAPPPVYKPAPILSKSNRKRNHRLCTIANGNKEETANQRHLTKKHKSFSKEKLTVINDVPVPINEEQPIPDHAEAANSTAIRIAGTAMQERPRPSFDHLKSIRYTNTKQRHKSTRSKNKKIQELFGTDEEDESENSLALNNNNIEFIGENVKNFTENKVNVLSFAEL